MKVDKAGMNSCIAEPRPISGTEQVNWMTEMTLNPSSFRCDRYSRLRKLRHREIEECNLFARMHKWAVDPATSLDCSISSQTSPSCQLQLSPKDSGIDINSPSQRDDGNINSTIMPDSRSSDCETTAPLSKRRRSLASEDSHSEGILCCRKPTRVPTKETGKQKTKLSSLSKTIMKKYTLISSGTESGPLVIKLRACHSEEPDFDDESRNGSGLLSSDHTESRDVISSTVNHKSNEPCNSSSSCKKSKQRRLSPKRRAKAVAAVVSSTTRNSKAIKKTKSLLRYKQHPDSRQTDIHKEEEKDEGISHDAELSQSNMGKNFSKTSIGSNFGDDAKKSFVPMPSVEVIDVATEECAVHGSNGEISSNDHDVKSPAHDNGTATVSSTCGSTSHEDSAAEKSHSKKSSVKRLQPEKRRCKKSEVGEASKVKKNAGFLNEFTKFIKSSDQGVNTSTPSRHPPGGYQVTRRNARIFRRSTLVPQLHRPGLISQELPRAQRHNTQVGKEQEHDEALLGKDLNGQISFTETVPDVTMKDAKVSADAFSHLDMDLLLDEFISEELLCGNQDENRVISDIFTSNLLLEDKRDERTLDDVPGVSSLQDDAGDITDDVLCKHVNESYASFISDQKQLIKLRHGVFCLLKTLVPQLQMPERFDTGGHAVDELVDVVCEELGDSKMAFSKNAANSTALPDVCLYSTVNLCRSPGDCLARLEGKVLLMLKLLLGIDLYERNLLDLLLDTIVSANSSNDQAYDNDIKPQSSSETQECFSLSESIGKAKDIPWREEAPEEVSSMDSFSDIPELLVESKIVAGDDVDESLEPPKLTAVDER